MELDVTRLLIALGIGLLIGAERERRKGTGPGRAPAGMRTFTLTAVLGGVSYRFGGELIFAVCAAFIGGVILLSYRRTHQDDPGITTEVALLVTFLLGALAMDSPALAAGIAVIVSLVLVAREHMHRFVNTVLSEQEVHDGLILAAAVLVILPLLPDRTMGPLQVFNPHVLWQIAVLVMAISVIGYIAVRILGVRYGLPLAGLASGFISSALTIGVMGAQAAQNSTLFHAAVAGAVLSTVATIIQLVVVLAATSTDLLLDLAIPLSLAGVTAIIYGVTAAMRNREHHNAVAMQNQRAFDLKVALMFSALITTVLFISALLVRYFGSSGILISAGVAGFADAHSVAISVGTLVHAGKVDHMYASIAVLLGLSSNTLAKLLAAKLRGNKEFILALWPGLFAVVVTAWLGLLAEILLKTL